VCDTDSAPLVLLVASRHTAVAGEHDPGRRVEVQPAAVTSRPVWLIDAFVEVSVTLLVPGSRRPKS